METICLSSGSKSENAKNINKAPHYENDEMVTLTEVTVPDNSKVKTVNYSNDPEMKETKSVATRQGIEERSGKGSDKSSKNIYHVVRKDRRGRQRTKVESSAESLYENWEESQKKNAKYESYLNPHD